MIQNLARWQMLVVSYLDWSQPTYKYMTSTSNMIPTNPFFHHQPWYVRILSEAHSFSLAAFKTVLVLESLPGLFLRWPQWHVPNLGARGGNNLRNNSRVFFHSMPIARELWAGIFLSWFHYSVVLLYRPMFLFNVFILIGSAWWVRWNMLGSFARWSVMSTLASWRNISAILLVTCRPSTKLRRLLVDHNCWHVETFNERVWFESTALLK